MLTHTRKTKNEQKKIKFLSYKLHYFFLFCLCLPMPPSLPSLFIKAKCIPSILKLISIQLTCDIYLEKRAVSTYPLPTSFACILLFDTATYYFWINSIYFFSINICFCVCVYVWKCFDTHDTRQAFICLRYKKTVCSIWESKARIYLIL